MRFAALPRPRVLTNGVFDLLHRGHVTYLEQARALGGSLTVAVNSDASVRRLGKGDDRPLNPLADRMAVLAALGCVDLVVPFDDDTPRVLVAACLPEVLVKGGGRIGELLREGDVHLCVPHARTARIQEVHLTTIHCLCDAIDQTLLGDEP